MIAEAHKMQQQVSAVAREQERIQEAMREMRVALEELRQGTEELIQVLARWKTR